MSNSNQQYFTILNILSASNQARLQNENRINDDIDIGYVLQNLKFDQNGIVHLMIECQLFRTKSVIIKLRSLTKDSCSIGRLITECNYCQTNEMLDYYKTCNPSAFNVGWLLANCKFCQTEAMLTYWKSLSPTPNDIKWIIVNSSDYQTIEMLTYFKESDPSTETVDRLIEICDYCQTTPHRHFLLNAETNITEQTCDPVTQPDRRNIVEAIYECIRVYATKHCYYIRALNFVDTEPTEALLIEALEYFHDNKSVKLIEHCKSNGPCYDDISRLMCETDFNCVDRILEFYLALEPSVENVNQTIANYPKVNRFDIIAKLHQYIYIVFDSGQIQRLCKQKLWKMACRSTLS